MLYACTPSSVQEDIIAIFVKLDGRITTCIWAFLLSPNQEPCLDKLAEEFRVNTEKLFRSALADWMKLKVLYPNWIMCFGLP